MITKKYKVLFSDLDDTLIKNASGSKFPKGVWDMKLNYPVIEAIKKLAPDHIHICTNQGGIQKKRVNREHFETKIAYVASCIEELTGIPCHTDYCDSLDKKDVRRKPNPGLLQDFQAEMKLFQNYDFTKDDCLMIGDASGKPGNFSDDDKMTAENFGCDYLDVLDFVEAMK